MRPEIEIPIVLSIAFVSVIAFILLKIKRDKFGVKKYHKRKTKNKGHRQVRSDKRFIYKLKEIFENDDI